MQERACLNCNHDINKEDAYCKSCGQKVDDNNLSLRVVFNEFFENYLSLDTRIGRSILPFLFQPGFLAKKFIEGKRASFLNPFRFYLVISIFFFFVLGILVDKSVSDSKADNVTLEESVKETKKEPSDLTTKLNQLAETIDSLERIDSVAVETIMDSLINANGLSETVTYSSDSVKQENGFVHLNTNGLGFNIDAERLSKLKQYRYDKSYSDHQLLDSLQSDSMDGVVKVIGLQAVKLYRSDAKVISRFVLGNLSLGMLILIPGLAFFFYLFYYKQRLPFVAHLIHSIQFHTFSLFVYALSILAIYYFESKIWMWFAFLASAVYLFFSLKKIYPKTIFSTFWRYASIGIVYYFFWVFTITAGVIISFLLF